MPKGKLQIQSKQQYPFLLIPKAFFIQHDPTYRAILAYIALIYYTNNKAGSCEGTPIKILAKRAKISESTIKRGLAELKRKGVVVIHKRSRKGPSGERIPLPNLYELANLQLHTEGEI